jgi:anti-sigma B factor antagonist
MSRDPRLTTSPIHLERSGTPDAPVLFVAGEIDVSTAPVIRDALTEAVDGGARRVTLDLGGVGFVDSSGLGVIVGALRRLQDERDGRLVIEHVQENVHKVFEITGLGPMFGLAPR